MSNTVIIIPSRLAAKRLPNKPLKLIHNKELILHVHEIAKKSQVGEVLVTTPDKSIYDLINKKGGKSFISKTNHQTGTDRVFEGFEKFFSCKPNLIINLQGDMPNLNPNSIIEINNYLKKGLCDIATLASKINDKAEIENTNIVKVKTDGDIEKSGFSKAIDFKREISPDDGDFVYHHIGIYGFTKEALIRYVSFKRSKLEIERNLEQMRAFENNLSIHVGYSTSNPLGVDTEEDLKSIKKMMENNAKR